MAKNSPILIVEDSDEDFEVTCWAFSRSGPEVPIVRTLRAEDAIDCLGLSREGRQSENDVHPCLVLLDLNLPGLSGRELLHRIKESATCRSIPVVILSTSKNPRDIEACYRLGASGYLCKPLQLDRYAELIQGLKNYWFDTVIRPQERS